VDVAAEQGSEATIREQLLNGNAQKSIEFLRVHLRVCPSWFNF